MGVLEKEITKKVLELFKETEYKVFCDDGIFFIVNENKFKETHINQIRNYLTAKEKEIKKRK